ncbi:hypothetical protein GCM10028791_38340 [Echinicola sediminis]
MNWGKGIILVFACFAGLIFTMVGICIKQDDIHLVTEHYYEEELRYQEQIEKISNTAMLEEAVMKFDASSKSLQVSLKEGTKGTLWLFRPSDARMDQRIDFAFENTEIQSVSLSDLKKGYWRAKVAWSMDGKEYFEELKISL